MIRSVAGLGPNEAMANPGLIDQVKAAGINALDQGFYSPPSGQEPNEAYYLQGVQKIYTAELNYIESNGMMLVAGGDNWARGTALLNASLTNPWDADATALALTMLRDSKSVPMLEMVDEATNVLGVTPPAGVAQLEAMFNKVPGRTPLSWPTFSLDGPEAIQNWQSLNDYYSWNFTMTTWPETAEGYSVPTWTSALIDRVVGGRAVSDDTKPLAISNVSVAGTFYQKESPGATFAPGQDHVQGVGPRPGDITAQIWSAVALGADAIRAYSYDSSLYQAQRAGSPIGTLNLHTALRRAGLRRGGRPVGGDLRVLQPDRPPRAGPAATDDLGRRCRPRLSDRGPRGAGQPHPDGRLDG